VLTRLRDKAVTGIRIDAILGSARRP
jgi:hypothetical protein